MIIDKRRMPPTLKQRLWHMFDHSLSTNGRISRQEYWLSWAVFVIYLLVLVFIIYLFAVWYASDASSTMSPGPIFYSMIVIASILPIWFIIAQSIKRSHDISDKEPEKKDDDSDEQNEGDDNYAYDSEFGSISYIAGDDTLWIARIIMYLLRIIIIPLKLILLPIIRIPDLLISDSYDDENIYGPVPTDEIDDEE